MNKLENIGAPKDMSEFQLGRITVIGGETEVLENEAKKASLIEIIPLSTCSGKEMRSFERRIRELGISKEELIETSYEIRNEIKEHSDEESDENIKIVKILKSKLDSLRYQIRRKDIQPMIERNKFAHEVKKGDKMVENYFEGFSEQDYRESYKKIDSKENGALRQRDIVSLYFSGKLGQMVLEEVPDRKEISTNHKGEIVEKIVKGGKKQVFKPLKDMTEKHLENVIIPGVKTMEERLPGKLVIQIRNETIPLNQFERRSFSLNDRSKDEISFLLNLKGDALSMLPCSYYKKPENNWEEAWIDLRALSYNYINYDKNHVVVIARKPTLEHIENRLKELHEEYYHFRREDGQWAYGLRGLSKYEESYEKSHIKNKKESGSTDEEIQELFECLQEVDGCLNDLDGRQTIKNIEYDIRNHSKMKYIFSKNSDELYFLKMALEDTKPFGAEVLTKEEEKFLDEVMGWRIKRKFSQKKITALLNVITGLHLTYEEEEDMGKYLSDELKEMEKVEHDRDTGHYKKHRNYYSQKEGVLAPNGTPETHKRRSNPPSPQRLRLIRAANKYSAQAGTKYSGVSNPEVLMEIYHKGGNTYSFSTRKVLGVDFFTPQEWINSIIEECMYFKTFPKEIEAEYWVQTQQFPSLTSYECKMWKYNDRIRTKETLKISMKKYEDFFYKQFWRKTLQDKFEIYAKHGQFPSRAQGIKYVSKILGIPNMHFDCFIDTVKELEGYIPEKVYKALFVKEIHFPAKVSLINEKLDSFYRRREEDEDRRNGKWNPSSFPSTFNPGFNPFSKKKKEDEPEIQERTGPMSFDGTKNKISININGKEKIVYAKGDLNALEYPAVAVAGTRYEPKEETKTFVEEQVDKYSDEYVVVSGLATGVDTIAHRRCLDNDGITIAVIPTGWKNIVPAENKELAEEIIEKGGLIISEHNPNKCLDSNKQYVDRNEIIAALAEKVIICEGGRGTAHTKRFAKEQKKELILQPNLG